MQVRAPNGQTLSGPHNEVSSYVGGTGVPLEIYLDTRSAFVVNDSTATSISTYEPEDPKFISVVGSLTCSLGH